MNKKIIAALLASLMLVAVMTGCQKTQDVWESYSTVETVIVGGQADDDADQADNDSEDAGDTVSTKKGETTKRTKKTTTKKGQVTTAKGKVTRATKAEAEQLTFTPVADSGANYKVSGSVSIAVDTVRPTDYEAMFDVMMKLYPDVKFEFDYWAHSTNDDAREYLSTRMSTGTAANIIWDEAGEIPAYIMNGWVEPITEYINKDPEAKNIPANLKESYTFFGEIFAAPHQATVETVAFNLDLLNKLSGKLPGLEWSIDEYEAMLRLGGTGFKQGVCVGAGDIHESQSRVCFYTATATGGDYGTLAFNYDTQQIDLEYVKKGATTMRAWRLIDGAEGWYQAIQSSGSKTLLEQQLGISNWGSVWASGKALMEETLTAYVEKWDNLKFNWKQWTTPNKDGNMPLHVDHCFITAGTPEERMDACYQALRFMTFSTNGNLARLTMYEDSQEGKYNLNSHVYYPTTSNKTVIEKFNALSCTDEVDEYILKNIPNSSREDTFKIIPEWSDLEAEYLTDPICDVTDGLKDGGNLNEPVEKFNKAIKQAWKDFEEKFNENYK